MDPITERFADAEKFRNKHWGETCIIVGNGPSLDQVPLDFLKSYPTFASNYIHLLDDFFPTYYTIGSNDVIDLEVARDWVRPIVEASDAAFISKFGYDFFKAPNVYPINKTRMFVFSYSPHKWVYLGANCTVTNLQFAYFMGFHLVYLVGVDHDYSGWNTGAPMHFNDKNYPVDGDLQPPLINGDRTPVREEIARRKPRPILVNPQGRILVDEGYLECARAFSNADRRVFTLGLESKLDVFPKRRPIYHAIRSGNAAQ